MDRFEHGGEVALGIEIGGGRDAEAAGERGSEIAQYVCVQVAGDDDIDALGLQHHARGHGVDQLAAPADIGIFLRHLGGDLVPHHHGVALRVGLGDDGELPPRPPLRQSEGKAHDAQHARAGEDRGLRRDFLGQAAMDAPAIAGIFALAVLAHDHPVEVARRAVAQRRRDARQHACRPHIGVLVEALADRQPQSPQRDVVGNVRIAHGAEEDRVATFQALQPVLRHHAAVLSVVVGAPGKMFDLEAEAAIARLERGEHAEPGGDDFFADAVGGNGGDSILAHGGTFLPGSPSSPIAAPRAQQGLAAAAVPAS